MNGPKKQMNLSWYIKLNILVMSFLFILFFMKQIRENSFQEGLNRLFSPSHFQEKPRQRSVKIQ